VRLRGRKHVRATVVVSSDDPSTILFGFGPGAGATYEATIDETLDVAHAAADAVTEAKRRGGE
jgi:hypothetical protein